jgi:hypothetical protein
MRLPRRTEIETAINHESHPADYIMFGMSNIGSAGVNDDDSFRA